MADSALPSSTAATPVTTVPVMACRDVDELVDDVAAMHADLSAAMRTAFGKVLAKGRPQIT